MRKPKALKKGDTIGIISPSCGLAGFYPKRFKRAINFLRNLGFNTKVGKYALVKGYIAGEPEERAKDLNSMLYDEEVKAILCTIGGEHCIQLIDKIDYSYFKRYPKIFIGYSDITVLHLAFYKKSKVVTFYGPMLLTQFGEYPEPFEYTLEYFEKAVMQAKPIGKIYASNYTDEFVDWKFKKERKLSKKNKFLWLKEGEAEGKLLGGCLPSLLRLAGTRIFPKFKNCLLFLELPEGEQEDQPYPIEKVDADLSQLKQIGIFDEINGLIFGLPYRYDKRTYEKLKQLLAKRLREYDFPSLLNVNFGHCDPIITLPYGVKAKLSSCENSFLIEESGVKE
jgi:muramoyltetrapeptide carboxypeptidase LdcA involved in peptidoglycan recycling